jgi:hypothetical protein
VGSPTFYFKDFEQPDLIRHFELPPGLGVAAGVGDFGRVLVAYPPGVRVLEIFDWEAGRSIARVPTHGVLDGFYIDDARQYVLYWVLEARSGPCAFYYLHVGGSAPKLLHKGMAPSDGDHACYGASFLNIARSLVRISLGRRNLIVDVASGNTSADLMDLECPQPSPDTHSLAGLTRLGEVILRKNDSTKLVQFPARGLSGLHWDPSSRFLLALSREPSLSLGLPRSLLVVDSETSETLWVHPFSLPNSLLRYDWAFRPASAKQVYP